MSPSPINTANNEVLPASLMAAALLAVAVAASTLVAQQPGRSSASQVKKEPVVNNADPQAVRAEVEAPIFGLTLEERPGGRVFVAAVEPNSRPWKAGFREGDYLTGVDEVSGLPYDKFLESVRTVANSTYEGDSFKVAIERGGRRHVLEVPGAGRSPENLRKLQTRSEKAIEKKLDPELVESALDPYTQQEQVSTADIEEYLELARRYQEEELPARDQRRLGELATVVVGGGWGWGGVSGVGLAAGGPPSGTTTHSPGPSTGSNWQRPGPDGQPVDAFEATAESSGAQVPGTGIGTGDAPGMANPGSGIGDAQPVTGTPRSNQLGAQMRQLQEMQAAGAQLTPAQTQRLAALRQLSQFANTEQGALTGRLSPEQMQGLQQGALNGNLTPIQRQNLMQLQQRQLMTEFASGAPGGNRNMPAFGPNSAQGRNVNQGPMNPGVNQPPNQGLNQGLNRGPNSGFNQPVPGVPNGVGPSAGPGIQGAGGVPGVGGAAGAGASIGAGSGASGVGVQDAGSGIGDAN